MDGEAAATQGHPIKTVVVLVQENRSFDHMLGWMKSINPEIDGVTGNESNPVKTADSAETTRVYFGDDATEIIDYDPGHSFQAIYEQVFGIPWSDDSASSNENPVATMEGFAQQAEASETGMSRVVMNGFKPENLPVYKALVSEFAVCDRWFASLPTSTQPNRLYIHSATSSGATSNDTESLIQGFPQKTIFESLEESGFTFGIYYQHAPATLFYRNLRKLKYIDNFHPFDLEFKNHCEEGTLPNYVVIEPRYFDVAVFPANDDHPPHDVTEGQKFVKEVYEALRSSPQWNEMLFIIIYDEHGGFYDHVPTPTSGIPNPDDLVGPEPYNFKFNRLGVRVPAILVSPLIEPRTVLHGPSGPYPTSEFEHSSIPATLKKIFNLQAFLTKRDEWAGTFEVVLTRSSPRTDCPDTLPEPTKSRETEPDEEATITEFQGELVQLAAVLNGDYVKDVYPDTIVENMKVKDAANYCEGSLQKFRDECEKARESGADGDYIVNLAIQLEILSKSKSFPEKVFSCLLCDK